MTDTPAIDTAERPPVTFVATHRVNIKGRTPVTVMLTFPLGWAPTRRHVLQATEDPPPLRMTNDGRWLENGEPLECLVERVSACAPFREAVVTFGLDLVPAVSHLGADMTRAPNLVRFMDVVMPAHTVWTEGARKL